MLERQGIIMNQKKLRRLYREEKLQVRKRGPSWHLLRNCLPGNGTQASLGYTQADDLAQ